MRTNKELTIEACKALIRKYRQFDVWNINVGFNSCGLCKIHRVNDCFGCPCKSELSGLGCKTINSYSNLEAELIILKRNKNIWFSIVQYFKVKRTMSIRERFWKLAIPYLETLPEEQFTPEGWKHLSKLCAIDRMLTDED